MRSVFIVRIAKIGIYMALLSISVTVMAQSKKPLTNADIIEMSKAGFSEETIIKAIEANEAGYDTSVSSLLELKKAGLSEKVVHAMLTASSRKSGTGAAAPPAGNSATSSTSAPTLEIGVYMINQEGKPVEVQPEIVTWRSGGFLKMVATQGIVKGDLNGTVQKPHSSLQTGAPVEFILRCQEGTSAAEYQLIKFRDKDDRREFRMMTGGVIHSSGGAKRDNIEFKFEKVAAATYKVKLAELKPGEYGFLAPGAAMSASAASSGKVYTFGIE